MREPSPGQTSPVTHVRGCLVASSLASGLHTPPVAKRPPVCATLAQLDGDFAKRCARRDMLRAMSEVRWVRDIDGYHLRGPLAGGSLAWDHWGAAWSRVARSRGTAGPPASHAPRELVTLVALVVPAGGLVAARPPHTPILDFGPRGSTGPFLTPWRGPKMTPFSPLRCKVQGGWGGSAH